MTHTHAKVKVKGHPVQKLKWKETDGRIDGRADGNDCITDRANAVGNKSTPKSFGKSALPPFTAENALARFVCY